MKLSKKRILIIIGIILIIASIVTIIWYNKMLKSNMPVLAYHSVLKDVTEDTDISIENFEWQMKYLKEHDYVSLNVQEFKDWKTNNKDFDNKKVMVTFDDGKETIYNNALPILEKYQIKAVVFVIGSKIDEEGYLSTNQIEDIKRNHPLLEIESHSYDLHNKDKANSNDIKIYNQDFKKNNDNEYNMFAYPFGISNNKYIKSLKNHGYEYAFLYAPSKWVNKSDNNYKLGRVPVYNSTSNLKFIAKLRIKL